LVLCLLVGPVAAQELQFKKPPTAVRQDGKTSIAFTLSAPADVEIAVLDASGKVVRHLAAGVLGSKAPPPEPLKPGLEQTLVWDGQDDQGKPAGAGPFKVRVRGGMRVEFGRLVGDSPYNFNETMCRGLAVDANGDLYLMGLKARDGAVFFLRVYDRQGKFLREILPYPSNLADSARQPLGQLAVPGFDKPLPMNYYSLWPVFYPFQNAGRTPAVKLAGLHPTDGTLLLMSESFGATYRLRKSDGGAVASSFVDPIWAKEVRLGGVGLPTAAYAPDGKTLYFTGYAGVPPKGQAKHESWPDGRVWRLDVGKGTAQPLVDVSLPANAPPPVQAWHVSGNVTALHGLMTDKAGRLFVCDATSGKIWVFMPDGKPEGSLDVPGAYMAALDEKTGALYVLTRRNTGYQMWKKSLVKLSGWKGGAKVLDTLEFPEKGGGSDPYLAADFFGATPQLWVSGCPRTESIVRIDGGAKLKIIEDLADRDRTATGYAARLAVDPEADLVYINNGWAEHLRYNGLTGAYAGEREADGRPRPIVGSELCVRRDGVIYRSAGTYSGSFSRLTRDLAPAPLDDGRKEFGYYYGRMGGGYFGNHGCCVAPDGTLYICNMFNWCEYAVLHVGPDGKPIPHERLKNVAWGDKENYKKAGIDSALIGWLPSQCGGLKVGRDGHVYLGLRVLPRDYELPEALAKANGYATMIGSIIKFKPSGGAVYPDDGRKGSWKNGIELPIPAKFGDGLPMGSVRTQHGQTLAKTFIEGAVRTYPGLAPFSGHGRSDGCVCQTPRFDVDEFGRLYVPNALTCSVTVLDNAGNEILRFGGYGNHDSQGPGSAVPAPAIPLGYPVAAQVSWKHIYVADSANRRVVRVDPRYTVEAVCEVK
jgi:hypothetical protein